MYTILDKEYIDEEIKRLKTVKKNLKSKKRRQFTPSDLTPKQRVVNGDLIINESIDLKYVKVVKGFVGVGSGNEVDFESLEHIEGYLHIEDHTIFRADNLKKIDGYLYSKFMSRTHLKSLTDVKNISLGQLSIVIVGDNFNKEEVKVSKGYNAVIARNI